MTMMTITNQVNLVLTSQFAAVVRPLLAEIRDASASRISANSQQPTVKI